MTAQHVHLLLNHLPIFGMLAALIPLGVGAVRKSRELVLVGLFMAVAFGAVTPVVVYAGESAAEDLERVLDRSTGPWIEEHEERAEALAPLAYVTAALCLAGFVAVRRRPPWLRRVSLVCGVSVCLSVGAFAWIGQAGGRIRHPELRPGATAGAVQVQRSEVERDEDSPQ